MQYINGLDESDSEISPGQIMTRTTSSHSVNENKYNESLPNKKSKIQKLTRSMSEMSFQSKVKADTKTMNSSFSSQIRPHDDRTCLKRKLSVVEEEDEESKDNKLIFIALKKFEEQRRKNLNKN
jgi:hypothetical protein